VSGGKVIAVAWLTFATLLIAAAVWAFSNMGDCPTDMTCTRRWWIDPLIFGTAIALWLVGIRRILRKKA
jgi:hypothetical protein